MIEQSNFKKLQVFKHLIFQKNAVMQIKQKDGSLAEVDMNELLNPLDRDTTPVSLTAASTMNPADNGNGKINLLSLLAGFDTTLPAALGTGNSYRFNIGIVNTSNDYGILANGTDTLTGVITIVDTDSSDNVVGFAIGGTDDKLEINGTTTGGLTIGDWVEFTDVAAGLWHVRGQLTGSGTIATPASAT